MRHTASKFTLVFHIILLASPLVHSQEKKTKTRPPINAENSLRVVYGSAPWNMDSTKIDNAELFIRDKSSGKILKILLEESEPDSSTFSGDFSLRWSEGQEIKPEVFIPPDKIRGNQKRENNFIQNIRKNKIPRKPFVFKRDEQGRQILDVYDTKEQARQAFQAYSEKIRQQQNPDQLIKPIARPAEIEAAEMAKKQAKLAELAAEAASREEERIRKEQLERQRAAERLKKQQQLKAQEREKLKKQAKEYSEQALEKYRSGDFIGAEELFKKSVDLDPTDTSYYFRYGVTLYRNEKYNDALVILNIAEVDETTQSEKNYYLGLIHFRLKELEAALQKFMAVKNAGHEIMSPSAAFYEGVILFAMEEFEKAKAPFEFVLDRSKDPRLDEKAEEYLEKIANALVFKKKQSKKHELSLTLGTNYDSNILFAPDNQTSQGTNLDEGGFRALTTANYEYRALYKNDKELSVNTDFLYFYSLSDDHAIADPMLATIHVPYTTKGVWTTRGYKFTVSPGYEVLYMDPDNTGTRVNILNSILLDTDLTVVMTTNWFSAYTIGLRSDDSLTSDSIGASDADAFLGSIESKQTFFLDGGKKRALQIEGGYTLNAAKGDEKKYFRIDLGAAYSQPFQKWKDASWNTALNLYRLEFPSASTDRKDTNYTLGYGFSKVQNLWFSWGTNISYTINNSSNISNQYSKYSILITASFDIDEWLGSPNKTTAPAQSQ